MICFDLSGEFAGLRMEGSTRIDYLQRLGSGDVAGLRDGQGAATCLLTPIGRMVDCTVALCTPDAVLLVCSATHKEKLHRWLRKFIFFNDDVRVLDTAMRIYGVFGEGADAWAGEAIAKAAVHAHTLRDDGARVIKTQPLNGAGYWLMGDAVTAPAAPAPIDDYHALRVAHGIPAAPAEINEDFIPLEAGLWSAVSFRKGCYTGQEIIARMESRNTVPRRLYLLHVDGAQPGLAVVANGTSLGAITSAAAGHALAYLRLGSLAEDSVLTVGERTARIVRAVSV